MYNYATHASTCQITVIVIGLTAVVIPPSFFCLHLHAFDGDAREEIHVTQLLWIILPSRNLFVLSRYVLYLRRGEAFAVPPLLQGGMEVKKEMTVTLVFFKSAIKGRSTSFNRSGPLRNELQLRSCNDARFPDRRSRWSHLIVHEP